MRPRNLTTGSDMEQNPEPCYVTNEFLHPDMPPMNTVPNLEPYDNNNNNNNSMFNELPQYHHQRAPGMSAAPNLYHPYANFQPPPSHMLYPGNHGAVVDTSSTEHERNSYFMDHGYKRKSPEVIIPGNSQYPRPPPPPCSFPQLNTPETAPFSFPQYGSTYPQLLDQRSVRNRAGTATMDHGHNNFIQGNYTAYPFQHLPPPPSGSIWYDQHDNGHRSDGSSSLWSQAPSGPYMHGNNNGVTGSIDSGNLVFPRYHETSSSRNSTPSVYPRNHYISLMPPPPPPPGIYPHMPSASYTVPETMHAGSYSHVGPVQSTGFRINQQLSRQEFLMPHFRARTAEEVGLWEVGDFYDAVNYVDHHEGMRLDIEDMSYEELLALSDQIGTVKTGLSEEDITHLLKRRTSLWTRINLEKAPSTDLETDSCIICQENYKNQVKIATLDCMHEYHVECLKKWLVIKNVCPICKSEALVTEEEGRLSEKKR